LIDDDTIIIIYLGYVSIPSTVAELYYIGNTHDLQHRYTYIPIIHKEYELYSKLYIVKYVLYDAVFVF